jgi:hypothetical protein
MMRCLTSALGRKATEKESFGEVALLIGEGEREGAVMVLHISDGWPTAHRSGGDAAHVRFPCLGSLTGGPRSAF